MTAYPPPSPPYLGPAKYYSEGNNKPIWRIVMHSTVGPTKAGSARGVADYFVHSVVRPSSAHYVVDAGEVVQVVGDSDIAYHAPPNAHSLGVEMCDYPSATSGERWKDKDHQKMFALAVDLVAQLCLAYDVPPYFVGPIRMRLGRQGVTTHAKVSEAWHETDHWDPGVWPRRKFMREVRKRIREIKRFHK
jgi:N-acetylmuramoyl-L-alanine amidase CwlA